MASDRLQSIAAHLTTPPTMRVAIVTGAAQGIGEAIALRLAQDGLDVALADLPRQAVLLDAVADKIRAIGRRAVTIHVDVSVEEDVQAMVSKVVVELGGLDVMVANAGIAAVTPILQVTMEEFDRLYSINVKGTLLCYQAAAKVMIAQGRGGRIIGSAFFGSYSASKFAVRALTQVSASEFGRFKITVNAYAPSITETPLIDNMSSRASEVMHVPDGAYQKTLRGLSALGRSGAPSEIAALVSYLASEEAGYITGQTLSIDGGTWFD